VRINPPDYPIAATNHAAHHPTNAVTTSKYTIATYLPRALFEQYRRQA